MCTFQDGILQAWAVKGLSEESRVQQGKGSLPICRSRFHRGSFSRRARSCLRLSSAVYWTPSRRKTRSTSRSSLRSVISTLYLKIVIVISHVRQLPFKTVVYRRYRSSLRSVISTLYLKIVITVSHFHTLPQDHHPGKLLSKIYLKVVILSVLSTLYLKIINPVSYCHILPTSRSSSLSVLSTLYLMIISMDSYCHILSRDRHCGQSFPHSTS